VECIEFLIDYDYNSDVIIFEGESFILSEDGEWYKSEFIYKERICFNYNTVHRWFIPQGIVKVIDE
jgi:hypothetical protein